MTESNEKSEKPPVSYDIAPAQPNDVPVILRFIKELAGYEREPEAVIATEEQLRSALFTQHPKVFAVVCRDKKEVPVGFALYFFNFSTWMGRHGLYLEDLYVSPRHRGCGAGKQLLSHLAAIAVREGCGRFEWSVLNWNQPAIDFYEAFGAEPQSEWLGYRLSGAPLIDMAKIAMASGEVAGL